jgi:UDP-glucose 4-epimerase
MLPAMPPTQTPQPERARCTVAPSLTSAPDTSQACGRDLPYKLAPRRPGDVSVVYADPKLALKELGWKAELGLDAMCADTWRWISENPGGFGDA